MKALLSHIAGGGTFSVQQATEVFELIMTGQATAAQMAAVLAILQSRGPTEDELVGAAKVMRGKVVRVEVPAGLTVVDTCGTGGTGSVLFNVSTTAALIVAAAGRSRGVVVAKHGNRSVTSQCGSSQLLEILGLKLQVKPATLTRCLREAGFCFCFAPVHHPAMKFAAPVRAELGFRTIFNLLGPLTNPAGAERQLLGVYEPGMTELIARVLRRLGSTSAMVVHGYAPRSGEPGYAELTTFSASRVSRLRGERIETFDFDPRSVHLPAGDPVALSIDSPAASAAMVCRVLAGERGGARDLVCLNAAAAMLVAGMADEWSSGFRLAQEAIDSGAALAVLQQAVAISQSDED